MMKQTTIILALAACGAGGYEGETMYDGECYSGNFGREVDVPAVSTGTQVLAQLECPEEEATNLTVVISMSPLVDGREPNRKVTITFGNGSIQSEMQVDARHGSRFTIPAGWIRVSVVNGGPDNDVIGAFIVRGALSEKNSPLHSLGAGIQSIGAGSSYLINESLMPSFAGRFQVQTQNPGADSYDIEFERLTGAGYVTLSKVGFAVGDRPEWVEIPSGTVRIRVHNTAAVGIAAYMVFELDA